MTIPLSYNLRNLVERKTTTVMTALGIALTVAVLLSILALVDGLRTSLQATGDPLNILVLRKGSNAELNSVLTPEHYQVVRSKPGIATNSAGQSLTSLELITVIVLEGPEAPGGINITLRGLSPEGITIRDGVKLKEGRWFQPGRREVVVGKGVAERYPMARMGRTLSFGRGEWQVVGVIDAGRGAANSEVFCDLNQLASDQNRETALSSILLRASDTATRQALINDISSDRRLNADALTERAYYEQQTTSAAPIQYLGYFVSIIMAIGSCFAAMNTMYAAVSRRSAEIGTLRILGFSRRSILLSFFLESLLLSIIGGILGCLLVLPLNNITTGIGSFVSFSEITFQLRVTPQTMLAGIAFAVLMGALGGLFPASSAARKEILAALRQV